MLYFIWGRMQWVITIWATGRGDSTSASAQVIYNLDWKEWSMNIVRVEKLLLTFLSVTGAHGRFVLLGEGGVAREARTQTLEPDVWICEVHQRGHGTRRRIQLNHLELWAVALTGSSVSCHGNIWLSHKGAAAVPRHFMTMWHVAIMYQSVI